MRRSFAHCLAQRRPRGKDSGGWWWGCWQAVRGVRARPPAHSARLKPTPNSAVRGLFGVEERVIRDPPWLTFDRHPPHKLAVTNGVSDCDPGELVQEPCPIFSRKELRVRCCLERAKVLGLTTDPALLLRQSSTRQPRSTSQTRSTTRDLRETRRSSNKQALRAFVEAARRTSSNPVTPLG